MLTEHDIVTMQLDHVTFQDDSAIFLLHSDIGAAGAAAREQTAPFRRSDMFCDDE